VLPERVLGKCALCDSPATTNAYELDTASNEWIPRASDPLGNMGKVLQGQENVWDFRKGFSWSDQWHHDLLDLCHTLPYSPSVANRSLS